MAESNLPPGVTPEMVDAQFPDEEKMTQCAACAAWTDDTCAHCTESICRKCGNEDREGDVWCGPCWTPEVEAEWRGHD